MIWILLAVTGLLLGLLGGGGGILLVPILVYGFGWGPEAATLASLFVVGTTAALAAPWRRIEWRTILPFAAFAMVGGWSARAALVPMIPDRLGNWTKGEALMLALALLMTLAAWRMIAKKPWRLDVKGRPWVPALLGVLIGAISATLGAGGGFLLVPVLTAIQRDDMAEGISASLGVIALQSAAAILGQRGIVLPWAMVMQIAIVTAIMAQVGAFARPHVPPRTLRLGFAGLVLATAAGLFVHNF